MTNTDNIPSGKCSFRLNSFLNPLRSVGYSNVAKPPLGDIGPSINSYIFAPLGVGLSGNNVSGYAEVFAAELAQYTLILCPELLTILV